ncbi:uncharacterized protein LOC115478604 isoform X2 [Microcaecilia unicolor]|uniref:Uncharacterized protein LOC115478604 isoform X2 n=1 Tax=Microcaecilia unicolor TaxID=1415580 RepID=A0A6P7Z948_9AMPH|nr:uncharacterized protein LOC115478604 isoform X2 [Microcaecilia unicolor]
MSCCTLVMELNRIIVLAGLLVNIKLSRMSPSRLPCDKQMISKYVSDFSNLEKEAENCTNVSLVTKEVQLPMVAIKLAWRAKADHVKGKEIQCHLKVFLEAVHLAHMHQPKGCMTNLLTKFIQIINGLQLILKNLIPQHILVTRKRKCLSTGAKVLFRSVLGGVHRPRDSRR